MLKYKFHQNAILGKVKKYAKRSVDRRLTKRFRVEKKRKKTKTKFLHTTTFAVLCALEGV